jgi:hypothetical protein
MACGCGANDYRRLAVVALEPDELELLIGLVEDAVAGGGVLEKLYAERRYVAIDARAAGADRCVVAAGPFGYPRGT